MVRDKGEEREGEGEGEGEREEGERGGKRERKKSYTGKANFFLLKSETMG